MISLSTLSNSHRPRKKVQRVGRGVGSGRGKTCGRGNKGDKARCGYRQRYGYEGGQLPLYRKTPRRGFTNGRFESEVYAINLSLIEATFEDGDTVNLRTLREKGCGPRVSPGGLKILAVGELTKKVVIEAAAFSKGAQAKLEKLGIDFKVTGA